jgi:hypothetical protein
MNSHTSQESQMEYAHAVQDERSAWHELQAQPPGSADRTKAWARWSEAISKTNAAWRRLNTTQRTFDRPATQVQPNHPAC